MRAAVLFLAIFATALPATVLGQGKGRLVGTWKLVSVETFSAEKAQKDHPFGMNPSGVLTYTPEGRVMVLISYDGRPPLSVEDRTLAPPSERAAAFDTFLAYAGRYTDTGKEVIHHVEIASVQNWVNTDQHRVIKLQGDRLTLTTPPISVGGKMQTFDVVWERAK